MVRTHPQWLGVRKLIDGGRSAICELIVGHFSYFRRDANDIRSRPRLGRRRDARHRLLSDHAVALAVRRRAGRRSSDSSNAIRSSASTGSRRRCCKFPDGPGDVHMRRPARAVSENADLRNEGAHRGGDSVQRAARSRVSRIHRRRPPASPTNPPKRSRFRRWTNTLFRPTSFSDAVRGVGRGAGFARGRDREHGGHRCGVPLDREWAVGELSLSSEPELQSLISGRCGTEPARSHSERFTIGPKIRKRENGESRPLHAIHQHADPGNLDFDFVTRLQREVVGRHDARARQQHTAVRKAQSRDRGIRRARAARASCATMGSCPRRSAAPARVITQRDRRVGRQRVR